MLSQVKMVPVRTISKGLAAETAIRYLLTVNLGVVGCICVVCDTCILTTSDSSVRMAARNTQLIEHVRIIYEKNLMCSQM